MEQSLQNVYGLVQQKLNNGEQNILQFIRNHVKGQVCVKISCIVCFTCNQLKERKDKK